MLFSNLLAAFRALNPSPSMWGSKEEKKGGGGSTKKKAKPQKSNKYISNVWMHKLRATNKETSMKAGG